MKQMPRTIGELKKSGYKILSVKDEMRKNLMMRLCNSEQLFPGIIGYDKTVVPAIVNALLAKHDIILLGLRGQAKTRIARSLISLLDDFVPVVKDCEINDNPYKPVCKHCVDLVRDHGDDVEIEWLAPDRRYGEKLATPDVTIADLIGDIDPIKAAVQKLHYSHEGAIHFGIIPRTNRGVFTINELPDLQPRIQVGLFNIMEEKDIQIRGFNIRMPLDVLMVFTANPEDYTNRGNIITPLKDRIDSQILTHYPRTVEEAMKITEQEAWVTRDSGREIIMPYYLKEVVEGIAFQARGSEFVDQKSGVSVRMTISIMENLISSAERRAIINDEKVIVPRICDLQQVLPGMTGKLELVFEGEQEGSVKVSRALIGKAVRETFKKYFPDPLQKRTRGPIQTEEPKRTSASRQSETSAYGKEDEYTPIISWFESGNKVEVADDMPFDEFYSELNKVSNLRDVAKKHMKVDESKKYELGTSMEFVLDGLHQFSRIAKDDTDSIVAYKDLVGSIFPPKGRYEED
jgi:magnesium chelatase subunit I